MVTIWEDADEAYGTNEMRSIQKLVSDPEGKRPLGRYWRR
jgi:hypothetical protein